MSTRENIRLISRTPLLSAAVVIGTLNDNFQNLILSRMMFTYVDPFYHYLKKKDVKFSRALGSRWPL